VLQFLFMPLIARDYWVSNFFGNTMYLLAFGYYFVITFLGYNGTYQKHIRTYFNANDNHSSTLPEPYGSPSRPYSGAGHSLVHQFVHF
jgi:hypothetical protein